MRVTAQELQHDFGTVARLAGRAPVTIADAGEDRLVLLSVEEYRRLMRGRRQVLRAEAFDAATLSAIADAEPEAEAAAFNSEWTPPPR